MNNFAATVSQAAQTATRTKKLQDERETAAQARRGRPPADAELDDQPHCPARQARLLKGPAAVRAEGRGAALIAQFPRGGCVCAGGRTQDRGHRPAPTKWLALLL
jgi:hypothetical protein